MVQVIQEVPKRNKWGAFAEGLGQGVGQGLNQSRQERLSREAQQEKQRYDQERMMQEYALKGQLADDKSLSQAGLEEESFDTVKQAFGENFAKVWKSSPVGGRTELLKKGMEALSRGINLDEQLAPFADKLPQDSVEEISEEEVRIKEPKKKGGVPEYNLDLQGYTPKEKVEFKSSLRKDNLPIWKDNAKDLKSLKTMGRDISSLVKLNNRKNLPEGLSKLLINPETGNFYSSVTALHDPHPDAQMWVKILARQATQAQTAFPGRVTNFDLQSFMLQFPSLFNTSEGRENILEMMKLDNKAQTLYKDALDKVYAKYGAGGVTPEDADQMARKMIQEEVESIDEQLINMADREEVSQEEEEEEIDENVVEVMGPNGERGTIDISEVELLPDGWRVQ